MRVLLVEPEYYTKYPPLGLMKIASYHRSRGNKIKLVRGLCSDKSFDPDIIEITSLFTYAWEPVHKAIEFYHGLIPDAKINVGGIYASIMPERIMSFYPFVNVHVGLFEEAEKYLPSYDILKSVEKWEKWDASILFTSRGCIRSCPFCVVPKVEGKMRTVITDIENFVYHGHKKVILWDNNFLASPEWKNAITKLKEIGLKIDFNQGLDARLINDENAIMIADLKMPIIRMAYDWTGEKKAVTKAVDLLKKYGIRGKDILFYTLYNFYDTEKQYGDTPDDFLMKVKDIFELGCVSYPMRYEPLDSLKKNHFISPFWDVQKLELIANARRVIGYGGAFPAYEGLVKKVNNANNLTEAFSLVNPKGFNKHKEANSICIGQVLV